MADLNFVGAPNFAPPTSPARHSSNGARRSRRGSAATIDPRLSIIEEDHPSPPLLNPLPPVQEPPRTFHRPFSRRFLGDPPLYSNKAPPSYTLDNVIGPNGEKFEDLRDNKYIASRGGLKRICIIFVVVLIILVALIVGLAVGLSKRNSSSTPAPSNNTSSSPATAPTGPFPVGSWTFTTFLSTVSANCTSNPKSWTCEPAQTFAQSPSGSQAMFNWIISDSTPPGAQQQQQNLSISSTDNPFAITFANTSLTLVDAGTGNERYTFKANSVPKIVYPSGNIKCYYNETTFSGDLYTKKSKTYPAGSSSTPTSTATTASTTTAGSSTQPFADWSFAVDATQSIGGGVDVPECYSWNNGVDGDRVTNGYTSEPVGSFCSCAYANYQ